MASREQGWAQYMACVYVYAQALQYVADCAGGGGETILALRVVWAWARA